MKKTSLLFFLLLAAAAGPLAGSAAAEFSLGAAYITGNSPYKDYDRQWMVAPLVSYDNDLFYIHNLSAGLRFFNSGDLKLSVFLAYDPTNFDNGDTSDRRLRRLDNRREGLLAGLGGQWNAPVGHLALSLAGDISGHSQGWLGRLAYSYSLDFGRFEFVPQLGTYWASGSYNDYYYGVSQRESVKSGLAAYEADSAFSPFLGLTINVELDEEEHWEIFWRGEAVSLPSTIKDSPMVDRSSTYNMSVGLTYTF